MEYDVEYGVRFASIDTGQVGFGKNAHGPRRAGGRGVICMDARRDLYGCEVVDNRDGDIGRL